MSAPQRIDIRLKVGEIQTLQSVLNATEALLDRPLFTETFAIQAERINRDALRDVLVRLTGQLDRFLEQGSLDVDDPRVPNADVEVTVRPAQAEAMRLAVDTAQNLLESNAGRNFLSGQFTGAQLRIRQRFVRQNLNALDSKLPTESELPTDETLLVDRAETGRDIPPRDPDPIPIGPDRDRVDEREFDREQLSDDALADAPTGDDGDEPFAAEFLTDDGRYTGPLPNEQLPLGVRGVAETFGEFQDDLQDGTILDDQPFDTATVRSLGGRVGPEFQCRDAYRTLALLGLQLARAVLNGTDDAVDGRAEAVTLAAEQRDVVLDHLRQEQCITPAELTTIENVFDDLQGLVLAGAEQDAMFRLFDLVGALGRAAVAQRLRENASGERFAQSVLEEAAETMRVIADQIVDFAQSGQPFPPAQIRNFADEVSRVPPPDTDAVAETLAEAIALLAGASTDPDLADTATTLDRIAREFLKELADRNVVSPGERQRVVDLLDDIRADSDPSSAAATANEAIGILAAAVEDAAR